MLSLRHRRSVDCDTSRYVAASFSERGLIKSPLVVRELFLVIKDLHMCTYSSSVSSVGGRPDRYSIRFSTIVLGLAGSCCNSMINSADFVWRGGRAERSPKFLLSSSQSTSCAAGARSRSQISTSDTGLNSRWRAHSGTALRSGHRWPANTLETKSLPTPRRLASTAPVSTLAGFHWTVLLALACSTFSTACANSLPRGRGSLLVCSTFRVYSMSNRQSRAY